MNEKQYHQDTHLGWVGVLKYLSTRDFRFRFATSESLLKRARLSQTELPAVSNTQVSLMQVNLVLVKIGTSLEHESIITNIFFAHDLVNFPASLQKKGLKLEIELMKSEHTSKCHSIVELRTRLS